MQAVGNTDGVILANIANRQSFTQTQFNTDSPMQWHQLPNVPTTKILHKI